MMKAALQHDTLFRYLDGQLSILLRVLEKTCLPPTEADQSTTIWPSARHLAELDSAVVALAIIERKKWPSLPWKGYKWVNKRWQKYRLVSRVEKLVRRARERLQEETEMDRQIAWPSQLNPDRFLRQAFLEWIAGLGNSDFLDVIDIVHDPDPQLHKGESYSHPHLIAKIPGIVAKYRERKQGAKRAANYRGRIKERENRHNKSISRRKISAKKA
jgi:hypothetical protein